jgi:hypothetical protein
MKDKTIDYILRATWQAVSRMYNEASKYGTTNWNWIWYPTSWDWWMA